MRPEQTKHRPDFFKQAEKRMDFVLVELVLVFLRNTDVDMNLVRDQRS